MSFEIENNTLKKYRGEESTVEIPDGIEEIDSFAFCNCYSIREVKIPDSVTEIGLRSP